MNVSRQIGWSQESNLLYQILKQLNKLTSIMFGLKPKYKVYTALLTQSGGDNVTYIGSDSPQPLVIGVTYTITFNNGTGDFTNIGAPNNNVGTSFVATGTTAANWGTPGDVEVTYNTGAPVVTVLENTIGDVWFDYRSTGEYRIYSDSQFIQNKTFAFTAFPGSTGSGGSAAIYVNQSPQYLSMETRDYTGNLSDDILYETSIEIRIYN